MYCVLTVADRNVFFYVFFLLETKRLKRSIKNGTVAVRTRRGGECATEHLILTGIKGVFLGPSLIKGKDPPRVPICET
jgi:hypothetical protein